MILGIGSDIIEIARIEKVIKNTPAFINKVFTEKERNHFKNKHYKSETIAGVFAAKEAVSKALGTGFRSFTPKDIEVTPNDLGKPEITLYDEAKALATELGAGAMHVTISHCKAYAVAYVVIERGEPGEINDSKTNSANR
ncbi:holo-ACP synthase [Cellulosilyticum sp. I15G10I2]|uniref:holo-ACP synthase n=1 Tax=Cellulosilyticum sp. I15G10I2 TaxID=1892843 RepID=UPI00085C005E|nr:holo-ACP synthase [Cellulosilyticum sp. I15G10I2]